MNEKLTLHEAVTRKFDKTPTGEIFTKDLKTIYSTLIICLELNESDRSSKTSKVPFFNRNYPFSFTLSQACGKMANLRLNVESVSTSTTLSYCIKPELAKLLIGKFMTAKLLHTPADRTRSEPKSNVLLQPTPKGIAIVQNFCKSLGFTKDRLPLILMTEYNSMDLFEFERSSTTDTILYSRHFINLLFKGFTGKSPNVWGPKNPSNPIEIQSDKLDVEQEFDFSLQNDFINQIQAKPQENKLSLTSKLTKKRVEKQKKSPFAHPFFTNPESDSHVQYYVSNEGVRLYKNYKFGKNPVEIDYCFNAKAAWQWLMDCTDIMYPKEAVTIMECFYRYDLISPIILAPSSAISGSKIVPSKTSFYTLTSGGLEISSWDENFKVIVTNNSRIAADSSRSISSDQHIANDCIVSSDDEKFAESVRESLTLKKALHDPGIRYLFRIHLGKEYCIENLDVYISIKQFKKKMVLLKKFMNNEKQREIESNLFEVQRSKTFVVKYINECLSLAYLIYSSYVAVGAPYQLNIDYSLREDITHIMTHTNSSVAKTIQKNDSPAVPSAAYLKPGAAQHSVGQLFRQSTKDATSESNKTMKFEKNNKKLFIEIREMNETFDDLQTPTTPTAEDLSNSLRILSELVPLFELVASKMYKLMELDSFPKFLSSETYNGLSKFQNNS